MKADTIILRVDAALKNKLKAMAGQDRRTLADFVRIQLEKLVETKKTKK